MNHKYVFTVFILKKFFTINFYPIEIIDLIIQSMFDPIHICVGFNFSICTINTKLYSIGNGSHGQLGLGDFNSKTNLCQIMIGPIHKIVATYKHVLALTKSFELYSWGLNYQGQLGLGDCVNQALPQRILLDNVANIAIGYKNSFAIDKLNQVFAWGDNKSGQLGLGHRQLVMIPTKLSIDRIVSVVSGCSHSMAVDLTGTLYAWGDNFYGQLGLGPDIQSSWVPVVVKLDLIESVATGDYHVVCLTVKKIVYVWGYNYHGQIGSGLGQNNFLPQKLNLNLNRIDRISCGYQNSFFITIDNNMYAIGYNYYGQVDQSTKENVLQPILLDINLVDSVYCSYHMLVVTKSGLIYGTGRNDDSQLSTDVFNQIL